MERAIAVSCNAYFAQLGVHDVGSKALAEMADLHAEASASKARNVSISPKTEAVSASVRGVGAISGPLGAAST